MAFPWPLALGDHEEDASFGIMCFPALSQLIFSALLLFFLSCYLFILFLKHELTVWL